MKILATAGRDDLANVFIAEFASGQKIEFTEALTPPLPLGEKWVLTCSTLFGCPGRCLFCDAGASYRGKLSAPQILAQLDYLVQRRFPTLEVPTKKFKIQLARMGEPSLNPAVLEVLRKLPGRYLAPGLIASLSTIAPRASGDFFERLLEIKKRLYRGGRFQLQFSVHTTDPEQRWRLMPMAKWDFAEIATYGERFVVPGEDRKITLNFALLRGAPCSAEILRKHFDPTLFLIKITPLNPTFRARASQLQSGLDPLAPPETVPGLAELRRAGFEVFLSFGETEENRIGSNCGQFLQEALQRPFPGGESYSYPISRTPFRP